MVMPGSRLHGASVKGSAAAPVTEPKAPVLTAPAKTTPRPSSARRSSRPLPATASMIDDLVLRRRSEMLIFPSLPAPAVGAWYGPNANLFFRSPPVFRRRQEQICAPPGLADNLVRALEKSGNVRCTRSRRHRERRNFRLRSKKCALRNSPDIKQLVTKLS